MKLEKFLFLLVFIFFCSGCASIVSESKYSVSLESSPSGANVSVKNNSGMEIYNATTPTSINLKASRGFFQPASYIFYFEKEGYNPANTSLAAGLDPWYVGNIGFVYGALIGWLIVDPASGAMWKLDDSTSCSLVECVNQAKSLEKENQSEKSVTERLQTLKELRDKGILTDEEYEKKRKELIGEL